MSTLTYTLIGDGSSDKALMNIIKWLIDDLYPHLPVNEYFADFKHLKNPPRKGDINKQVRFAYDYYPFDILIYHRDAEENTAPIIDQRKEEILGSISEEVFAEKVVCLVPVVMMESWLLFDETSIKKAAENKNYSGNIDLPPLNRVELISDPKSQLHNLLRVVSCKKKRSLKEFNVHKAVHLVAENITDFSPLRQLQSFKRFEHDIRICIDKILNNGA